MILRFFQWVAEWGWVYDCIQRACGTETVNARMAPHIPLSTRGDSVLDVGGGTGLFRRHWPSPCRYICLDLEAPKLRRFRAVVPDGLAIRGDATVMPLATASIHAIICRVVAHHLSEELLEKVFKECRRVLKPNGTFLFLDAVSRPDRPISRFLWRLDRGAHPHSAEYFQSVLKKYFVVASQECFDVYHQYVFYVLRCPPERRQDLATPGREPSIAGITEQ